MRYAPHPPFKYQDEIQTATHPKSSKAEVQAVWEKYGYLQAGSINVINAGHFALSALASIQTEAEVLAFIDSLDNDAQRIYGAGRTCTKARIAREEMRRVKESNVIVNKAMGKNAEPQYVDAIKDLARRTCCGCHETGSYHPVR